MIVTATIITFYIDLFHLDPSVFLSSESNMFLNFCILQVEKSITSLFLPVFALDNHNPDNGDNAKFVSL